MVTKEVNGTFIFTSKKLNVIRSYNNDVTVLNKALAGTFSENGKTVKILGVDLEYDKDPYPMRVQVKVKFEVTTILPDLGMNMMVDIALAKTQELIAESFPDNDVEYLTVVADF